MWKDPITTALVSYLRSILKVDSPNHLVELSSLQPLTL